MNNFNFDIFHIHTSLETFRMKLELKCIQDKFDEKYPKCPLCKNNIEKEEHLWKKFRWGKTCCNCYYNRRYYLILKSLESDAKEKLRQN